MYKVMLVDDDVPMLEYISRMLDWRQLGLEIAGSTYSSELALELFRRIKPDLVITDIGLPVMDGLELSRQFREIKPDIRIIFLTCYEDAAYLKKAFQLEADDYLIKDELTEEKLLEAVNKSLKWFRGQEESLEKIAYRCDIERNKDVLKQQFFEQVLKGGGKDTLLFGERLGIHWSGEQLFLLTLIHPDAASVSEAYELADMPLLLYGVYNIALELGDQDGHVTPFLYKEKLYLVCHGRAGARFDAQRSVTFIGRLMAMTQQFLRIRLTPVHTNEWVGLGSIGGMYKKVHALKERLYYSEDGLMPPPPSGESGSLPDAEDFKKERAMAQKAFEDGNPVFADLAMESLKMKSKQKRWPPHSVTGACEELVRQLAGEYQFQLPQALLASLSGTIRIDETADVMKSELKKLLKRTLAGEAEPSRQDPSLAGIHQFIQDHIHETVTSIDAANFLRLNSSYFSRLFKKKTGINFTEYVHQYKMKVAKRLLDEQGETVESVAYALGYSDRAYFSKVFKKYVGASPSDYKHSQ